MNPNVATNLGQSAPQVYYGPLEAIEGRLRNNLVELAALAACYDAVQQSGPKYTGM